MMFTLHQEQKPLADHGKGDYKCQRMPQPTMNEAVTVKIPGSKPSPVWVAVQGTESDLDVATRLCRTRSYPLGTLVIVDGTKFKIHGQDPLDLTELKPNESGKATPLPKPAKTTQLPKPATTGVQVGQRWVTKDPRRKQEPFEVMSVYEDHLVSDKGAKIQLHRLSRYKLVG
jgi:hypothetical protein